MGRSTVGSNISIGLRPITNQKRRIKCEAVLWRLRLRLCKNLIPLFFTQSDKLHMNPARKSPVQRPAPRPRPLLTHYLSPHGSQRKWPQYRYDPTHSHWICPTHISTPRKWAKISTICFIIDFPTMNNIYSIPNSLFCSFPGLKNCWWQGAVFIYI